MSALWPAGAHFISLLSSEAASLCGHGCLNSVQSGAAQKQYKGVRTWAPVLLCPGGLPARPEGSALPVLSGCGNTCKD